MLRRVDYMRDRKILAEHTFKVWNAGSTNVDSKLKGSLLFLAFSTLRIKAHFYISVPLFCNSTL